MYMCIHDQHVYMCWYICVDYGIINPVSTFRDTSREICIFIWFSFFVRNQYIYVYVYMCMYICVYIYVHVLILNPEMPCIYIYVHRNTLQHTVHILILNPEMAWNGMYIYIYMYIYLYEHILILNPEMALQVSHEIDGIFFCRISSLLLVSFAKETYKSWYIRTYPDSESWNGTSGCS